MRGAQLAVLCLCNTVIFVGISAVVGLMPVYLSEIGADTGVVGGFLALAYLALALSNGAGGYLSNRSGRRKVWLIGGGLAAAPLAALLGRLTAVGPLALTMAGLWFAAGIALAMINILVGLLADVGTRGRSFGVLNLSSGLGLLLGSAVSGRIVDRWGFGTLFAVLAATYLVIPCAGLLVRDPHVVAGADGGRSPLGRVLGDRTFLLLFCASVVGQASNSVIFLSRTLRMHALHFDATAISTAAAVGSLVSLPLPLVVGRLADRWSRKLLLLGCFVSTTAGLLVLALASADWHFWVASVLQTVLGVSVVVASAVVSDRFADEAQATALALLTATPWIGIVLGLSLGGLAIRSVAMVPTLLASAVVSVVAVALLVPVQVAHPERSDLS